MSLYELIITHYFAEEGNQEMMIEPLVKRQTYNSLKGAQHAINQYTSLLLTDSQSKWSYVSMKINGKVVRKVFPNNDEGWDNETFE